MENSSFQSSEDIERALMDLGPLLGVSIKEEITDDLPDPAASSAPSNVASASDGVVAAGSDSKEGEGADSLASPGDSRGTNALTRCVLCQACLMQTDGTPKLMECLHSACEPCIKVKIEEKQASSRDFLGAESLTVTCPSCRLQCSVANMIDQRFVLEKMVQEQAGNNGTITGEQQCNSCEDTEPATSYCVDCAEFICDNCVHAHQRLKITKDHTIKSKEEAIAELQAAQSNARSAHDMFCNEHTQERLSLFCETCDRLTCRDCQLTHHRDHKYQFSTEMAAQARASISTLLSEVSYKRVLLGSAMKVIRDRQQLIADKKKALVHEITQTVVKLTNAINTRGKQLVLRLNEVCDAKQRTLAEKKQALEQLADITEHCVTFVSAALQQGSDTAVLHSKRCVCGQLQRVKLRRADIPNPEIPVRIALAIDKLPDMLKVLSNIGNIVVDGKVDGAAASPQGPYHPPAPAPGPPAPAPGPPRTPPQSAVVALQHVAMQQQYSGRGYLQLRARAPAPHVSSTTHPHHLHGLSEVNLRGLLNASGGRPRHMSHPAMHHPYHMMNAYAASGYPGGVGVGPGGSGPAGGGAGGRRSAPRTPSPAPPPPHATHNWHIPQHTSNGGMELSSAGGGVSGGVGGGGVGAGGAGDYKITLGRQRQRAPAVTSTNPNTPSPSINVSMDYDLMGGGGASLELDKVCAESVQDLMATIAKLDSNGVQVLREPSAASPAPSPKPSVHSSTGDHAATKPAPAVTAGAGSDPNEDWCAVCMDGGELVCCDNCPKVFHQYCHIPTIDKLPDESESWQCLLCVNFASMPPEDPGAGGTSGLSPRQQKVIERITLELYCQYETSLAFREPVPAENTHYHSKISRPMCLDMIRLRLQPGAAPYTRIEHFLHDCRQLFNNAYTYNPPDSQFYKDAKRLEEFFDSQLLKWLPEYAYWSGEGSPPHKRPRNE